MIKLLVTDVDEARGMVERYVTNIKFQHRDRIIEELKDDQTIRQIIDRVLSWYIKPTDGVFLLVYMKILGVDNSKELSHLSDEQVYNELSIALAKSIHNFDDDETDILRI